MLRKWNFGNGGWLGIGRKENRRTEFSDELSWNVVENSMLYESSRSDNLWPRAASLIFNISALRY